MFDRRLLQNFDWLLLVLTLLIALLGVATIVSASEGSSDGPGFWIRQFYWIGLGLGAGFVVLLVDFRTIGEWSYWIHGAVVASLLVLLIMGAGSGEVERWFLVGPVAVQPSEFAKLSTLLAVAYYFRDPRRVGDLGLKGLVWPALIVLVPFFLIVQQPDLGTAGMLIIITLPMLVMAGLRTRLMMWLVVAGLLGAVALVLSFQLGYYEPGPDLAAQLRRKGADQQVITAVRSLEGQRFHLASSMHAAVVANANEDLTPPVEEALEAGAFKPYISYLLRPYQQRRLITFINPDQDPLGADYHVIQSKIAIGSGTFTGKGYGNSTQGSLNFLPARHTDFIFSIFAEEWGFLGVLGLLALYVALAQRGLSIIFQTTDRFSAFLALGVTGLICLQGLINILMAVGLLPVVGVPLPFFSYGGSSMITCLAGVALLLNVRMRRFLWV